MTFDEKLALALRETGGARYQQYSVGRKHHFSLAYRLWRGRTIRSYGAEAAYSGRLTLRQMRHALLAIMLAGMALLGAAAYAVGSAIWYQLSHREDHSRMSVFSALSDRAVIGEYYGLSEEDGWEIEDYSVVDDSVVIVYERGGENLLLSQRAVKQYAWNVNTEKVPAEKISVFAKDDGLFMEYDDERILIWFDDGYIFEMVGKFTKNEVVELAKSVKKVE